MSQLQVSVLGRDGEGNVVSDSVTVEVADAPGTPAELPVPGGPEAPAEPVPPEPGGPDGSAPADPGSAEPAPPGEATGEPSFPPSDMAPEGGQPDPGDPGAPGVPPPPPFPTPPALTDLGIAEMGNPTGQAGVDTSFVPPETDQADRSQTLFRNTGGYR